MLGLKEDFILDNELKCGKQEISNEGKPRNSKKLSPFNLQQKPLSNAQKNPSAGKYLDKLTTENISTLN